MEENEMFVTENEEIYEPEIIEEAAEVETLSLIHIYRLCGPNEHE